MPLKDCLAALIVIVAWGVNFVVIKVGLQEIPPFLLGCLRFALVALAAFFVPRPAVSWRLLIMFGMTLSVGQFAFLFTAMTVGMSAGLASLVLQSQAFFTVLIAALLLGERMRPHHIAGMVVAAAGLGLIQYGAHAGNVTALGFVLTLAAAFCWACGNIVVKYTHKVDVLGLVVWGAVVPPIPFLLLSWAFEGKAAIYNSLANLSPVGFGALIYLALIATTLGYVLWAKLLTRHPVGKIAPLSLLVPIVGLISAMLLLGESLSPAQWLGGAIAVLGLAINVFGSRFARRRAVLR
ncbi:EamA family transporter [Eoetvoesiella caeni]